MHNLFDRSSNRALATHVLDFVLPYNMWGTLDWLCWQLPMHAVTKPLLHSFCCL